MPKACKKGIAPRASRSVGSEVIRVGGAGRGIAAVVRFDVEGAPAPRFSELATGDKCYPAVRKRLSWP